VEVGAWVVVVGAGVVALAGSGRVVAVDDVVSSGSVPEAVPGRAVRAVAGLAVSS
jgi:hypothetical protein